MFPKERSVINSKENEHLEAFSSNTARFLTFSLSLSLSLSLFFSLFRNLPCALLHTYLKGQTYFNNINKQPRNYLFFFSSILSKTQQMLLLYVCRLVWALQCLHGTALSRVPGPGVCSALIANWAVGAASRVTDFVWGFFNLKLENKKEKGFSNCHKTSGCSCPESIFIINAWRSGGSCLFFFFFDWVVFPHYPG